MSLDWWGLGLQAVNVLVLVWLLSRIFWRPVAGAIARRQAAAQEMLDSGRAAQAKVEAALAEVSEARAGIAAEREAVLAKAKTEADAAREAALADARTKAETLLTAARATIEQERANARRENAAQAAALSVEIAARLLRRFDTAAVRAAFLAQLVEAIAHLSASDRAALVSADTEVEIVSAADLKGAEKAEIEKTVREALGGTPALRVVADPELIAGLDLRSAHFVLHNSWRADLEKILREVKDAA